MEILEQIKRSAFNTRISDLQRFIKYLTLYSLPFYLKTVSLSGFYQRMSNSSVFDKPTQGFWGCLPICSVFIPKFVMASRLWLLLIWFYNCFYAETPWQLKWTYLQIQFSEKHSVLCHYTRTRPFTLVYVFLWRVTYYNNTSATSTLENATQRRGGHGW